MRMERIGMVAFCVGSLLVVALFWGHALETAFFLFCIDALALLYFKRRRLLFSYLFGFFFGPLAEVVAIHAGAWTYAAPQFFGMPLWLPFLWGSAVITFAYFYDLKRV
jgi:hypothetical protein